VRLLFESVEHCANSFSIFLRIPAWSKDFTLRVNGESSTLEPGNGYLRIRREWRTGDYVELDLSMKTELVESHPFVEANRWKAAVKRGPIVFCAEHADNPTIDVRTLALKEGKLQTEYTEYEPLGKVVTVTGRGIAHALDSWKGRLYTAQKNVGRSRPKEVSFRLVPYFSWANREAGSMTVWMGNSLRDHQSHH
jgi:hypothetical protein